MGSGVSDAWGGSWGASWGVSWGAGQVIQPPAGGGGGALSGPARGRYRPMRYRPEDRSVERITLFAREISEQLEQDAVSASKAAEIAARADRLKALLAESVLAQDYLVALVVSLIEAVRMAAAMDESARRQMQLLAAAEIAARLEADLRDEEDALILLMV